MSSAIIGIAGLALTAGSVGYGIYNSEQQKKKAGQARSRDAAGELRGLGGIGQGQVGQQGLNDQQYAQMILGMNPAFAAQQVANQKLAMKNALKMYPQFAGAERQATSKLRGQNLTDLEQLGLGYQEAYAAASPGYARLLEELHRGDGLDSVLLDKLTVDALGAGRSRLGGALEDQALNDLSLGRGLSEEQQRAAEQASRGAYAARGLGFSNAAIGSEILGRDQYAGQLEAGRRQFAGGVMGLLTAEDQANRGFGLDVLGTTQAREQANRGWLLNAAQATNDPLNRMLASRTPDSVMSGVIAAGQLGMPVGMPAQIASSGPQLSSYLPPLYNYGADAFNTNLNMMDSRHITQQNQSNAMIGSLIGMGGQLAGTALRSYGTGGSSTGSGTFGSGYNYGATPVSSIGWRPSNLPAGF